MFRPLRFTLFPAVLFLAVACSTSPSEPSTPVKTGTLILITGPCSLTSAVHLMVDGADVGAINVPGQTQFTVPAGRHTITFLRDGHILAGDGLIPGGQGLLVLEGGSVTISNPPGACAALP